MACNFLIPFSGTAQEILIKAGEAIKAQGGSFVKKESGGSFDVNVFGNAIKGSFSVSGNHLNVIIDSKPFLIPCSTIESFLRSKLS